MDIEALHFLVQFSQVGCIGENATVLSMCDTIWKAVAEKIIKAQKLGRINDVHILSCTAIWSTWMALPSVALPNAMFEGLFSGRSMDELEYLYEEVVLPMIGVNCRALYAFVHMLQQAQDGNALVWIQPQRAMAALKNYITTVDIKTIYALYAVHMLVKTPKGVEEVRSAIGYQVLVTLLPRQYPEGHAVACILMYVAQTHRQLLIRDTDIADTLLPLLGSHENYDALWQQLCCTCHTCRKMLRRQCVCRS